MTKFLYPIGAVITLVLLGFGYHPPMLPSASVYVIAAICAIMLVVGLNDLRKWLSGRADRDARKAQLQAKMRSDFDRAGANARLAEQAWKRPA